MLTSRWQLIVCAMLVAMVAVTGCKKKPRGGAGVGGDNVGGITGTDPYGIDGSGLGERSENAAETAGQFEPVFFGYDSAQVSPSESSKLDAVAAHLRSSSGVGVIVEGHCDERGSNEYNLSLGERRALAVRAYLIGLGIDAASIQTKSYGEERPVAAGHDESSWSQNRRAEFVLFQ